MGTEPVLTTDDDNFHEATEDPWWTETVWFAWMVPERKLLGYFYPVFRPNVGVQFGGVLVVDDSAELPWEIPIFEFGWHAQIPDGLDLRDAQLDNGMRIKAIEPARVFELRVREPRPRARPPLRRRDRAARHRSDATVQQGSHRPDRSRNRHDGPAGRGDRGRLLRDARPGVGPAAGRPSTEGRLRVRHRVAGARVPVASRSTSRATISSSSGFLQRDGEWSRVAAGRRTVARDERGRPVQITIDATDERGRSLHAVGHAVSRQVFTAYPSMFCWNSLVHWELDGAEAWGEDQDVWHPRKWRDFAASLRTCIDGARRRCAARRSCWRGSTESAGARVVDTGG